MNLFAIPTLFFEAPSSVLPPSGVPAPPSPEPTRARRATCEFCECVLTATGEVLTMSDKAKKHRDREAEIEDLRAQIRKHETIATELRAKITELSTVRERGGLKLS